MVKHPCAKEGRRSFYLEKLTCLKDVSRSHEHADPRLYFIYIFLYTCDWVRQTKYIVILTKEGCTKIVYFMTPGAGVPLLGTGHVSRIVKMH